MSWWHFRRRTEADIQKARLLEDGNTALATAMSELKSLEHIFEQNKKLEAFLSYLQEAKSHLDKTKDARFTNAIDEIIRDLNAIVQRRKSMNINQLTTACRPIIRNIKTLQDSILQEIRRL